VRLPSVFKWVVVVGVMAALPAVAPAPPVGQADGAKQRATGARAAEAQTAAAETPAAPVLTSTPTEKEIADAVERLGSADPAEREQATRYLWAAGSAAEAALKEAAESDDAEVAGRATQILRNLRYGIRPDTPPVISELLTQYRQADASSVPTVITNLAGHKPVGIGVLTRLWQDERDEGRRRLIAQTLSENMRPAAALLLADRAYDAALRLIEAAAEASGPAGERSMRDLAALLLLRGGLDERIAALKPVVADEGGDSGARVRAARLLVYLCRARGDLTAAKWAATRTNDPAVYEAMLIETADWKELSQQVVSRQAYETAFESLGFAAAYHRMAGDAANFEKAVAKIGETAEKRPHDAWLAAEALALNDRPGESIALLKKHGRHAELAEVLAPRTQFKELLDLVEEARAQKSAELPHVEARAAVVRHFLGDSAGAKQTIERLLKESGKPHDFRVYVALAEAAREIKNPALAEEVALQALAAARPMDDADKLMEAAGFSPGARAARWWSVLRQKYREPTLITFGRLKSLWRGEMPAAQAEALARTAADDAIRVGASDRDEWVQEIGLTLIAAGHRDAARSYFRRLNAAPAAAVPMPVAFIRLGDLEAQDGKWDDAAALYGRAWEMERFNPLPLLLRAAALAKIGREKEGRELAELAHLLPLSNESARHDLMKALEERKLWDEAARQRDVIVRTSQLRSWYQGDALRRAGDAAYEKGQYLAAAALWDRAFLDNQDDGIFFAETYANFLMPSLIHRARAMGLMRSGEMNRAMEEADLAMRYTPGDADALIALVNELDKLGRKSEADAFYAKHAQRLLALCEEWPKSGQMHNQYAWVAAKCKRDLDRALGHARRAVEIEPTNTASLDTLAEAHFQRGEVQQAIEVMNKCVELEPKEKHHAEQLARFNKALTGK